MWLWRVCLVCGCVCVYTWQWYMCTYVHVCMWLRACEIISVTFVVACMCVYLRGCTCVYVHVCIDACDHALCMWVLVLCVAVYVRVRVRVRAECECAHVCAVVRMYAVVIVGMCA